MQFESSFTSQNPLEVFLSYSDSESDTAMQVRLEKFLVNLKRKCLISSWHKGNIVVGRETSQEIKHHLDQADIVLLLVSQDLIASDYYYKNEIIRALERHKRREARVIPILLSPCMWRGTPLGELEPLPMGGEPITRWSNRDEAFVNVAEGIEKIVKELTETSPSPTTPAPPIHPMPLTPRIHTLKKDDLKYHRGLFLVIISIIVTLVFGGILLSLLTKPSTDPFPALCNGNFQSAKTAIVPVPVPSISPAGQPIGLSVGAAIFDLDRFDRDDKLQAARNFEKNADAMVSSLENAIHNDPTDAEALIYLENWNVLKSDHPHITVVVGVAFPSNKTPRIDYAGTSRDALQGAYTAQKECNDQNHEDTSKTQIVLMIANIGGNNPDDRATNAKSVADQICRQADKDKAVVAILGWLFSADSLNMNQELKKRGSSLAMVSPSSASDDLEGMSNFFRICQKNNKHTQMAADFLLKKSKKRIGIIFDQSNTYGITLKNAFTNHVEKARIVDSESYKEDEEKTLKDALTKVLAKHPDALFFSGYEDDLFNLLPDISSTNLLIVAAPALNATNNYKILPPGLDNVYFTASASPDQWEKTGYKPPFFQKYQSKFGTLTAPTGLPSIDADVMLSYDAMLTLIYGTQKALSKHDKTVTPHDLGDELKQITLTNPIQGITGHIAFDSKGDQDPNKIIFMEHIEGTKLIIDERHGCLQVNATCEK